MRGAWQMAAAGMALLLVVGCGDTSGPSTSPGSVLINAPRNFVEIDSTVQLSASVTNQTGGVMASPTVTWSSSDNAVATVSASGMVTGRSAGEARIRARAGSAADSVWIVVLPPQCTVSQPRGTITSGQSVTGTLSPVGCALPHGSPAEGWAFAVGTTTTIAVNMTSSAFTALIIVTDMNLNVISFNMAFGPGSPARLLVSLPPGEYRIWATTDGPHAGSYQMNVQPAQTGSCTEPRGTIALGQMVSAALSETGSCLMTNGRFADVWEFNTATAMTIRADMVSNTMDTFLYLVTPDGQLIAVDDDSGEGFNSRIVTALPPGRYFFMAANYLPGTLGNYQLSVSAGSAGASGMNLLQAADKPAPSWEDLRAR